MLDSKFYHDWYEQVCAEPENDYVVVISASSRTPVSGTGKTTMGLGMAKALDRSEGGFDAETQSSLNADEFANDIIPDAPKRGAVLMDEAQGTPGAGSGLNRMRAMSQATLEAVGSVLANRDKNLTIIIIVQQFGMLFSDFYPMVDSWLLINRSPGQRGGPAAKHHKVFTQDYPDAGGGLQTPVTEVIDWPAVPGSDDDYLTMESKKQDAKTKGGNGDGDGGSDELADAAQVALAQALANNGVPMYKIPDQSPKLTYSKEWYRQRIDKPDSDADAEAQTV